MIYFNMYLMLVVSTYIFIVAMNLIMESLGKQSMKGLALFVSCVAFPCFWFKFIKNTIIEFKR